MFDREAAYTCDQCSIGYQMEDALERHKAKSHNPSLLRVSDIIYLLLLF